MIIFELDNVLANCEHRKHFIDPEKDLNLRTIKYSDGSYDVHNLQSPKLYNWKPDWKSYYEACAQDEPIETIIGLMNQLLVHQWYEIEIWSDRSETVKNKTIDWLKSLLDVDEWFYRDNLKMRPIGNTEPAHVLKERWLDMCCAEQTRGKLVACDSTIHGIEIVFDADPESIAMWKRRGVFVFDCRQE